ncbi:MAG TPA: sulfite exporter TauE/SafE family protein [Halomicronema sp.]
MIDLLLIITIGFFGSFGHCIGMCGPLTVGFSLSQKHETPLPWQKQIYFHILLNFGRILSYTLTGALIGALGEITIAGGELAGIGSILRRSIAILTGLLLILFGLSQINPQLLQNFPKVYPSFAEKLHQRLTKTLLKIAQNQNKFTPLLLGLLWGFIPCGFLYAAQIKAAETGSIIWGSATMFAFGLGTMPSLIITGLFTSKLNADQRSQLYRLAGWITLTIGILTLLRSDAMIDYTGHTAILLLILTLIARPISRIWGFPLRYRRAFGVGAFILSIAHTFHTIDHTLNWNYEAIFYLLPAHQIGIWAGIISLILMIPLALTSFDKAVNYLGKNWRILHLLSIPALILVSLHTILIGSHYLGELQITPAGKICSAILASFTIIVLLVRNRFFWSLLSLEKFYVSPIKNR